MCVTHVFSNKNKNPEKSMKNRNLMLKRLNSALGIIKQIDSSLNSVNVTKQDLRHNLGKVEEVLNECMDIVNREEISLK